MIDWLNDNSGAVQAASAVVLALTLIAVAYYAKQTRKQAQGSERMAAEMERTRHASVRPVLNISPEEPELGEVLRDAQGKHLPPYRYCRLGNIGTGPALNAKCDIYVEAEQRVQSHEIGALEVGETYPRGVTPERILELSRLPLALRDRLSSQGGQDGSRKLSVIYEDIYANVLESYREVYWDEALGGVRVGPLKLSELQT